MATPALREGFTSQDCRSCCAFVAVFHQIICGPAFFESSAFLTVPMFVFMARHKDFHRSQARNPTGRCRSPDPRAAGAGDGHDAAALLNDHVDVGLHDLRDLTHLQAHTRTNISITECFLFDSAICLNPRGSLTTVKLPRTGQPLCRLTRGVSKNISLSSTVIL